MDEYPSEEALAKISAWDYKDPIGLAEYIVDIWHYGEPWALLSDWRKDDLRHEYRELRLATGGWSGNEEIIAALDKNQMFSMLCWYMSQRGGLHIYHIPKLENPPPPIT
jgi:hypothetical protein